MTAVGVPNAGLAVKVVEECCSAVDTVFDLAPTGVIDSRPSAMGERSGPCWEMWPMSLRKRKPRRGLLAEASSRRTAPPDFATGGGGGASLR